MPGRAFQSRLIPYKDEIFELRRLTPPVPYARIAEILQHRHNLRVCRETIFKFVRARCRRRKALRYEPGEAAIGSTSVAKPPSPPEAASQAPKAQFRFTPSDRYNLKRLPKEQAAAIRKRLEEEGH